QSSHADRIATIAQVYRETQVLIDPHTADGVKVARDHMQPGVPMLVLETALPAKFSETIEEAIGQPAPVPEHLQHLNDLPQRVVVMDADVEQVRAYMLQNA
ncbi:MAG: threonine synthase, partial [Alcaligenaceae bacterium]|nr:threonine synthase [Alcaligenaceae bacterium]